MDFDSILHGKLGIIGMRGCEEIAGNIDDYLKEWRKDIDPDPEQPSTYLLSVNCPRFASGEAKGVINQSVRGYDVYIISDVFNYGVTYKMYDMDLPMSPDDHFQDLKRVIAAIGGKASRITVLMPMLYEGRQHKRMSRESLDCALALQELTNMGVDNILTFDAHDPRVQNAIPLKGFENVQPYYQMIKALINNEEDVKLDNKNLMICSPDEGGMSRCIYYSSLLGLDLGMFYKRRDYSRIVNGRNPILSHDYLGGNIKGKDVIIIDDMISSGDSIIDVSKKLKERGARKIYAFVTFGLFVAGLDRFNQLYEEGTLERVFTTNLIYRTDELKAATWYREVDMSKYVALIIDTLNHDQTLSQLLNPADRISKFISKSGFSTMK